ncbi:MAG: S8 family serine peptidase, partial [Novosphingobium sp.]|nr:S8 family serine peptidase [Novosphingobium sp.]
MPAQFDTVEFRNSDGPGLHNAAAAWQDGWTGQGVTIGVVDSGIHTDNTELAGRISGLSADFAGNGSYEAVGDHGTWVSLVAAAARDDSGIVGIAYDATIMALRTDTPGTCETTCSFEDSAIADAINYAVSNGATVINISLGGGPPNSQVTAAIANAAANGVVVVVSAGNDGASRPDAFATGMLSYANGNLIIAGSIDSSGDLSSFSNKAGAVSSRNYYLAAQGEDVSIPGGGWVNGTSFSAPQIAGAVALLAQAFPTLTGSEIVDILLTSAFDAGATGTDPIYGRGILDIAAAFQPLGTTSLAGSQTPLSLNDTTAATSPAMGDAVTTASVGAVILDGYDRAYVRDLASAMRTASLTPRLTNALAGEERVLGGASEKASFAFTIDARAGSAMKAWPATLRLSQEDAREAKVLAAKVALRLSPDTQLGFAFSDSADGLVA